MGGVFGVERYTSCNVILVIWYLFKLYFSLTGKPLPLLGGPAVWPLYYTAQALIVYGVMHLKH